MPCAFQFAEGDGGNQPGAAAPGFVSGYGFEDLPLPSTLVRADLRGVLPDRTIFNLAGEAESGNGSAIFASSGAGNGAGKGLLAFAALAFGIYYLSRQS
jgi:hypothetical protein